MSARFHWRAVARVVVLVSLVFIPLEGFAADSHGAVVPRTVSVDPLLRSSINQMLATSETFRSQCERLDRAEKLVVLLRLNPTLPRSLFRARTTVRRYSSGLLIARIEVAPGADEAEWIAHEFEHVIEQIEGGDLRTLASREGHDAWHSVDGMIETQRAYDAGLRVLLETRSIELPDKFVE